MHLVGKWIYDNHKMKTNWEMLRKHARKITLYEQTPIWYQNENIGNLPTRYGEYGINKSMTDLITIGEDVGIGFKI